ncbi:MAG TPA: Fic family protein [Planctomycetaceae bacterium]
MTECPDWANDITSAQEQLFIERLAAVDRMIRAHAIRTLFGSDFIEKVHGRLFEAFVPLACYAGNFRQDGGTGERVCLGRNVQVGGMPGTPYWDVHRQMLEFAEQSRQHLAWLELQWQFMTPQQRAETLAKVAAVIVGHFIQIHPFINGNGRLSRILWRWTLVRFGCNPQLRVHPRPDPPYPAVMAAAMRGDYGPLSVHILKFLAQNPQMQRTLPVAQPA